MHPDLVKLLELQNKDLALQEVDQRLQVLQEEVAVLDQAVDESVEALERAGQAAADAAQRRIELETKIETYRTQQERRRQRLEVTRPGKEAANLMAELDLARSVLAQEESEWVRLADTVTALEGKVEEAAAALNELKGSQEPVRAELLSKEEAILAERKVAEDDRGSSAVKLERTLLVKYDQLRKMRENRVVVALNGAACGGCFTTIPIHRLAQIKAGTVLGSCEVCGVILFVDEQE